jgi:hypothetical protein
VDGIGVHECDLEPEEALARSFVDHVGARIRELGQCGSDVGHPVGDVVHTRPALREKPSDRSVLAERFEQLDPPLADSQRHGTHTLLADRGSMLDLRAEEPFVRCERLLEILDGDAEVVDATRLHAGEATEPGRGRV